MLRSSVKEGQHAYTLQHPSIHPPIYPNLSSTPALCLFRALANAEVVDCRYCGPFCEWDQESEWQDNFQEWDRRLKYYDRTYGPLFDEW